MEALEFPVLLLCAEQGGGSRRHSLLAALRGSSFRRLDERRHVADLNEDLIPHPGRLFGLVPHRDELEVTLVGESGGDEHFRDGWCLPKGRIDEGAYGHGRHRSQ